MCDRERQTWDLVDDAVNRLEESWRVKGTADLAQLVPPADHSLREPVLVELIKVDQEYRWQSGEHLTLEDYLADWPEVSDKLDLVAELLEAECVTRGVLLALPSTQEIRSRYPDLCDQLDWAAVQAEVFGHRASAPQTASNRSSEILTTTHPDADSGSPIPRGHRLGRYEVRGLLGQGKMGAVYRAYDPHLDREVALKKPHLDPTSEPSMQERFLRESRAAARIRHPNTCPIYDAGHVDGVYYLAMALIEGQSLQARIGDHGLPPQEAAQIVRKIARAVEKVHQAGIVHRDIKSSNIMIDAETNEPLLMDFGLARQVQSDSQLTANGSVIGTPAYMSPQQAEGQPADAFSDIYSLGVLLYQLLTGRLPFPEPYPQILAAIVESEPLAPRTLCPQLDSELEAICLGAMAKNPADRYRSARAMAEAIEQNLQSSSRESEPWLRRRRWVWLSVAGTAVLLLWLATVITTLTGTLVLNVNPTDAQLTIDGRTHNVLPGSTHGGLQIKVPAGRHDLKVTKDGFQAYTDRFTVGRLGKVEVTVTLDPTPPPGLEELEELTRLVQACSDSDDVRLRSEPGTRSLREKLIDFRIRHAGTPYAVEAARLMARIPWPVDALARSQIDPRELRIADSPDELVAILAPEGPERHFQVRSLAVSSDRHTLASGSLDGTVKLWDLKSRHELHVLDARCPMSRALAFSGDGTLLAGGCQDGSIKLWKVATGDRLATLTGHEGLVHAVAFSGDGETLASSGSDGTVRLWNVALRRLSEVLKGHQDEASCVAFTPGGQRVVSGSYDQTVRFWDIDSRNPSAVIKDLGHPICSLAVAPDGKTLAVGTGRYGQGGPRSARVILCHAKTGNVQFTTRPVAGAVFRLAFGQDGKGLLFANGAQSLNPGDTEVWVNDPQTSTWKLHPHRPRNIKNVAFGPSGRSIVWSHFGSYVYFADLSARVADRATVDGQSPLPNTTNDPNVESDGALPRIRPSRVITGMAVPCDGETLAVGAANGTVTHFDLASGEPVGSPLKAGGTRVRLAWSPNGKLLAIDPTPGDGQLLLRRRDGQMLAPIDTEQLPIPLDGSGWLVVDDEGFLRVSVTAGLSRGGIQAKLAFTSDGRGIATACLGRCLRVFDVAHGELLFADDATSKALDFAFSPDGKTLAAICFPDHSVAFFSAETGEKRKTRLAGEAEPLWQGKKLPYQFRHLAGASLAFHPNGRELAVARYVHLAGWNIELWDAKGHKRRMRFGVSRPVSSSMVFSPDGSRLAFITNDIIQLWDSTSGELWREIGLPIVRDSDRIVQMAVAPKDLAFTPDGRHMVTSYTNGGVYVLRLKSLQ